MYINFLSVQNNFSTGGIYMEHNKENENKSIEEEEKRKAQRKAQTKINNYQNKKKNKKR